MNGSVAFRDAMRCVQHGCPVYLKCRIVNGYCGCGSVPRHRGDDVGMARLDHPTLYTEDDVRSAFTKYPNAAIGYEGDPPRLIRSIDTGINKPRKAPLIAGLIPQDSLVVIYGAPGSGKGFVAEAMSMALAQGIDFLGIPTAGGPVLYLAQEAEDEVPKRWEALRKVYGCEAPGRFDWVDEGVNFLVDEEIDRLVDELSSRSEKPGMVIIDTLAQSMVGGDENTGKDMGKFVAGCTRIRKATGAAVCVLHHCGKDGKLRGHTSLPGAADTIIKVTKKGQAITLHCDKQRPMPEFADLKLELAPVDGTDTCYVTRPGTVVKVTENGCKILQALLSETCGAGDLAKVTEISRAQVYRDLERLEERGLVEKVGGSYSITERGKEAVSQGVSRCLTGLETVGGEVSHCLNGVSSGVETPVQAQNSPVVSTCLNPAASPSLDCLTPSPSLEEGGEVRQPGADLATLLRQRWNDVDKDLFDRSRSAYYFVRRAERRGFDQASSTLRLYLPFHVDPQQGLGPGFDIDLMQSIEAVLGMKVNVEFVCTPLPAAPEDRRAGHTTATMTDGGRNDRPYEEVEEVC